MYDSYMSVNKNFKSSVNLQYDLYNDEKIRQYIPTTDLCDVIEGYIDCVLDNGKKSTFLAGPYGKGKSYLMLMISYFLSKRENRQLFKETVNKIKKINERLADKLERLDKEKISLLPVVVNNNSSNDLNRNFLIALNSALIDHNIKDIVPNSSFSEALRIIESWETEDKSVFNIFNECQKSLKIDYPKLKQGLLMYDGKAFDDFKKLFKCVNHGYEFISLISEDFANTYDDVSRKIVDYGYNGLFVIFDEFGVFLENQGTNFTSRLNQIQSFSEKCESSKKTSQMHLCCITHKDVTLYSSSASLLDSFETIAGRFKLVRFDRSLEENYQIICSAIHKNDNYTQLIHDSVFLNYFVENVDSITTFSNNDIKYIVNNGFPFNPFTLFVLIQVSEKVAQNERTLFTFMSDTDLYGFNDFIANNDSGLLNVPLIYDYFETLIKDNNEYKYLYYKVESLNRIVVKKSDRDIVKCIALSKIVNDPIKYPCTDQNIALSLGLTTEEIKPLIVSLINSNIIKRNINDNTIDFSIIADLQFVHLLDNNEKKLEQESLSKVLNDFNSNKYFVSNRYNFTNKMTRFFRSEFIEVSTLNNLNSLSLYFDKEFCDGIIFDLINDIKLTKTQIQDLVLKFNKPNVIFRYNKVGISPYIVTKLYRLKAAKDMLGNTQLSVDVKELLPIYISEESIELNTFLEDFEYNSELFTCLGKKYKSLQECINDSLSTIFKNTLILNNEQINKNEISSVTSKSRTNIVDLILNSKENCYSSTSAEGTIYESFNNASSEEIVEVVKDWFISSKSENLNLSDIVTLLMAPPYGIRKGVIPLIVAKAISELAIVDNELIKTIILYNGGYEISLSAVNLCKALITPEKYTVHFAEINQEKLQMLDSLLVMFNCKKTNNFNENIINLVESMRKYVNNLPPIIIKANKNENLLGLSILGIKFKDKLLKHDINVFDYIFNELPKLLNSTICEVSLTIQKIMDDFNKKIKEFYQIEVQKVINTFGITTDSIKQSYDLWKVKYPYIDNVIFENQEKSLFKALKEVQFNNKDSINLMSYSILNCTLDDWNTKKENDFFNSLNKLIDKVSSFTETDISKEEFNVEQLTSNISQLGKTMYSNILDIVEEYGASISNEEKASIIKLILKDLID